MSLRERITEITGQNPMIKIENEGFNKEVKITVGGRAFSATASSEQEAAEIALKKLRESDEKHSFIKDLEAEVDNYMFKALMLEGIYCTQSADTFNKLAEYRKLQAIKAKNNKALDRKQRRKFYDFYMKESSDLIAKANAMGTRKYMLITHTFDGMNGDDVVEAKDRATKYFNEAFDLFMCHCSKNSIQLIPAIKVIDDGKEEIHYRS